MSGVLFGIGVGAGSPDEITVRALSVIKDCKVLFFPSKNQETCKAYQIAKQAFPQLADKELVFCDFPMSKDENLLNATHNSISDRICSFLSNNKNVGFLTLGDVALYSTFSYIDSIVKKRGFQTKMISGVSSVNAVAAALGIPLAKNSEELHIIPQDFNLQEIISKNYSGNLVFMKSGKKLSELKFFLQKNADKIEFLGAVCNCGFEKERTAKKLSELDNDFEYMTVAIAKIKSEKSKTQGKTREGQSFFQNKACKSFPCHKIENPDDFNCLFCFCPLSYRSALLYIKCLF